MLLDNFTWLECIPQLGIQVAAGFVQVNEGAGAGKNQSLEWDNDRVLGEGLHRMRGCTIQILPKEVADKKPNNPKSVWCTDAAKRKEENRTSLMINSC